jgi:hypothetical protein
MASYNLNVALINSTLGIPATGGKVYTTVEEAASMGNVYRVGTSDETLTAGDVATGAGVWLKGIEGTVVIGFDGTNYDMSIGVNDLAFIPLRNEDKREVTRVTAVADVAGSLSATYFDLTDRDGPVRVWIDVADGSTAPAVPSGGRLVEVNIASGATAIAVATAIATSFAADLMFSVLRDSAILDFTDAFAGTRTDVADGAGGAATGFTLSVTQQGAAARVLRMKTLAGTAKIQTAILPL